MDHTLQIRLNETNYKIFKSVERQIKNNVPGMQFNQSDIIRSLIRSYYFLQMTDEDRKKFGYPEITELTK